MSRSALVTGGTGPTGPGVVQGLLDRGFDVAILHGGQHEVPLPPRVRHIHADPHWPETLRAALGDARFDLVVAQYGRLAVTADILAGRTDPYALATPCHPYWRHGPDHRLRSNARIRDQLGYADTTAAADALGATVDWLVAHRPRPGCPEEARLRDPFGYAHEDELIARWSAVRRDWPAEQAFRPTHAYRHPRRPGEAWRPDGSVLS